jgi:mannan endo-1,4-beta-mannosidase
MKPQFTRCRFRGMAVAGRFAALASLAAAVALALAGCGGGSVAPNTLARSGGVATPQQFGVEPTACGVVEPPASGAYLGLYRPPAPFQMSAFDSYVETVSPKAPAILMWYQQWAEAAPHEFDQGSTVSAYQRGVVPMITWEPWDPGPNANYVENPSVNPAWGLRYIVGGQFDDYIRSFAQRVKTVKGPVMIRPMHEMNGRWYPWAGTMNGNTPQEFVAAWRRIHDLFAAEGVTNVTWVWSINSESLPATAENRFGAYYPGDKYVDWVGISGFNWGASRPPASTWRSFSTIYDTPLAYLKSLKKPVVISEFGCVEGGGDKAAWLADAYTRIRTQHPEVKAVLYFDSFEKGPNDEQDWRIATSQASLDAYRQAVADPYYRAAPMDTLGTWTSGLTTDNWTYLKRLPAAY